MKVSTEDNNFYCIIYQQGYNIRSITCYFLKRKQLYCNVSPLYEVTGDFCPYRAVQMFKSPTLLGRNRIFLPEHSSSCMLCTHLTNSLLFLFCGGSGQISVCLQSGRIRDQLSSAGSGFLCPTTASREPGGKEGFRSIMHNFCSAVKCYSAGTACTLSGFLTILK